MNIINKRADMGTQEWKECTEWKDLPQTPLHHHLYLQRNVHCPHTPNSESDNFIWYKIQSTITIKVNEKKKIHQDDFSWLGEWEKARLRLWVAGGIEAPRKLFQNFCRPNTMHPHNLAGQEARSLTLLLCVVLSNLKVWVEFYVYCAILY